MNGKQKMQILPFDSTISLPDADLSDYFGLPNFVKTISPNDPMFTHHKDADRYHWIGRSAWESIMAILAKADIDRVDSILDFGCGHGRVCRALRASFPHAEITACDLIRDGVDFCAKEFRAIPVYSSENIKEVSLSGPFDLIFAGSVFSHIDRDGWLTLLELFNRTLSAGGILIGSYDGPFCYSRFLSDGPQRLRHGIDEKGQQDIIESFNRDGYGHAPYQESITKYRTLGLTFVTPRWVDDTLTTTGFTCFALVERGYGGLQDVFGCHKTL